MPNRHELKERTTHGQKNFPISVYSIVKDEEQVLTYHWHDEAELIYLKKGNVTFYIDTIPVELREGEAAFVRSGQIHGAQMHPSIHCEFISLVFSPRILSNETLGASYDHYIAPFIDNRLSIPRKIELDDYGKKIIAQIERIIRLFDTHPDGFEIEVISCLYAIFYDSIYNGKIILDKNITNRAENLRIDKFKKALDFIHSNYDKKISIGDMAASINMSSFYFCRFFKSLSGKSPLEYLNSYRISKAALWIRQTDDKITDIALDAGFSNFSYFIKLFRLAKGCTPTAYRSSMASEKIFDVKNRKET